MGDGIHDFKVTDCQKNPLEELIILCNVDHAYSDSSKEMIKSSFLSVSKTQISFNAST